MPTTKIDDHANRITVLETRGVLRDKQLAELLQEVKNIHDDMTKYKGMVGAVTFFGSCFAVAAGLLKDWFMGHWK